MNRRAREVVPSNIPNLDHALPMRFDGLPVQDLVALRLDPLRRRPPKLTKIITCRHINPHIHRLPRRIRQTPHRTCHHLGRSRVVLEIQELDQVAVLLPVLDAHVLVLLRVVLVRLDETHPVEPRFEKGPVVAAAAVAVQPINNSDRHLREGVGRNLIDMAAQVARGTIIVPPNTQSRGHRRGVLSQRRALAKKPDVVRVGCPVCGFRVADHVEIYHGGDVGRAVCVGLGEVLGA